MCLCPLKSKHKVEEVTTVTHEIIEVAILSNTRRSSPLSDKGSPPRTYYALALSGFHQFPLCQELRRACFHSINCLPSEPEQENSCLIRNHLEDTSELI